MLFMLTLMSELLGQDGDRLVVFFVGAVFVAVEVAIAQNVAHSRAIRTHRGQLNARCHRFAKRYS